MTASDPMDARALLAWQVAVGADEAIGEIPIDRTAIPEAPPRPAQAEREAPPPRPAPPPRHAASEKQPRAESVPGLGSGSTPSRIDGFFAARNHGVQ